MREERDYSSESWRWANPTCCRRVNLGPGSSADAERRATKSYLGLLSNIGQGPVLAVRTVHGGGFKNRGHAFALHTKSCWLSLGLSSVTKLIVLHMRSDLFVFACARRATL